MLNWYLLSVWGGSEGLVKVDLERRIRILGLQEKITKIIIPVRKYDGVRRHKKILVNQKFFGGIVLIKMILDQETWALVRATSNVMDFMIAGDRPAVLSNEEADNIIKNMVYIKTEEVSGEVFNIGDYVVVTKGPFVGFKGQVESVKKDKVRAQMMIFRRVLSTEFGTKDLEKVRI